MQANPGLSSSERSRRLSKTGATRKGMKKQEGVATKKPRRLEIRGKVMEVTTDRGQGLAIITADTNRSAAVRVPTKSDLKLQVGEYVALKSVRVTPQTYKKLLTCQVDESTRIRRSNQPLSLQTRSESARNSERVGSQNSLSDKQ